jgi:hypothetical protein
MQPKNMHRPHTVGSTNAVIVASTGHSRQTVTAQYSAAVATAVGPAFGHARTNITEKYYGARRVD